jgi:hypothetical protein
MDQPQSTCSGTYVWLWRDPVSGAKALEMAATFYYQTVVYTIDHHFPVEWTQITPDAMKAMFGMLMSVMF